MNLFSITFFVFILILLLCYYIVPKKFQWLCLLTGSLIFYLYSGIINIFFLIFTSLTTFLGAKIVNNFNDYFIQEKKSEKYTKDELKILKNNIKIKKRIILLILLILNFGILGFLKYWNTIAVNLHLTKLIVKNGKTLLLPLGISFYTFQSISYFMDVYNQKFKVEKNYFKYLLFISFFPQLIQGPINRYDKLGSQLSVHHSFNLENFRQGFVVLLYGALKKYAIADLLYSTISGIFDGPYNNLPGSVIVFGILLYSVYQYADFSGGIDMVLGIAKMFGLDMQPNFKQPYFSVSLADFWRRWHISLGLWMKDYVFYPFVLTEGMQKLTKKCNKISKHLARTIPAGIANILVFLIVGIWHGPEMHYVLWGLYNGLVIALSDFLKPAFNKSSELLHVNKDSKGFKIFQIVRTFIIVNIGWYFDCIVDVKKSFVFLKNTIVKFEPGNLRPALSLILANGRNNEAYFLIALFTTLIVFTVSILAEKNGSAYAWFKTKKTWIRWGIIYLFVFIILLSSGNSDAATGFMYANY